MSETPIPIPIPTPNLPTAVDVGAGASAGGFKSKLKSKSKSKWWATANPTGVCDCSPWISIYVLYTVQSTHCTPYNLLAVRRTYYTRACIVPDAPEFSG